MLNGPPGAGKSAVAPRLAERLGVEAVDLDALVAARAGMPVPELIRREGEVAFRQVERELLAALLDARAPAVIAVGGGALTAAAPRRRALREATVVTLDAPPVELLARIRAGEPRPLVTAWSDPMTALAELLDLRAGGYAEAHYRVSTAGASADDIAAEIAAKVSSPTPLVVPLGARTYRVFFAPLTPDGFRARWAESAPGVSAVVGVTERRVAAHCSALRAALPAPDDSWLVLRPGESSKTLANVARLWSHALARGADRSAAVLCLGGGVVTDLGGFAAATLLRGVRYASVPTSLLGMVDASVGGKTAVDLPEGKNLAGAFHHPSLVWMDVSALRTLSTRELRSGLAEVVKVAVMRDEALLADLEGCAEDLVRRRDDAALARVVRRAVQAKVDVVAEDEREGGLRALLNFGHTVGHGVESASRYRLRHGECVAVGMRAALDLGAALGVTPPPLLRRVGALLDRLGLPSTARVSRAEVERAMAMDKKRGRGALRFALARGAGDGVLVEAPMSAVMRALDGAIETR